MTEAVVRLVDHEDGMYVHAADVAALLLDCAQTVEQQPALTAAAVLRFIAYGLAAYEVTQPRPRQRGWQ